MEHRPEIILMVAPGGAAEAMTVESPGEGLDATHQGRADPRLALQCVHTSVGVDHGNRS